MSMCNPGGDPQSFDVGPFENRNFTPKVSSGFCRKTQKYRKGFSKFFTEWHKISQEFLLSDFENVFS